MGALTVALALALGGCAATPTATSGPAAPVEGPDTPASVAPAEAAAPETAQVPVNAADLPGWFPGELPMPAGDYRWASEYDSGVQLDFLISDADVAEAFIADLAAAGYAQTQYTEHPDGTGRTWFTEGPAFRANVVVRGIGSDSVALTLNVEPK